jgi:hypothetical protein
VLDGSAPLSQTAWQDGFATAQAAALDHLFAACAADATCTATYPDLRATYQQLIDRLAKNPLTMPGKDFSGGMTEDAPDIEVQVDAVTASAIIEQLLLDPAARGYLPAGIDAALGGDTSVLALGALTLMLPSGLATAMHYATICAEDPAVADQPPAKSNYAGTDGYATGAGYLAYLAACRVFDVAPLASDTDTNLSSNVPVLFLNGGYDTRTPAWDAAAMAYLKDPEQRQRRLPRRWPRPGRAGPRSVRRRHPGPVRR